MSDGKVTRRKLMHDGATVAAGVAAGLGVAGAAGGAEPQTQPAAKLPEGQAAKILNYNSNMEYRRFGKTGLMVSAISLGGHWKKLASSFGSDDFKKNRHDVVSACIDNGINLVDACTGDEVMTYSQAIKGRRDKMYVSFSWYEREMRFPEWQTAEKLIQGFEEGLRQSELGHADVWRITCLEPGGDHTLAHEEAIIKALEKAKKDGKARFVGFSSHDRGWLKKMIETYPQVDMILTPYTAGTKKKPEDSLFDALKEKKVGMLGIKPFASGSVFRSRGEINPATLKIDDERARLTLRYVLANDALTAAIPGMISVEQVKNAAQAVLERRKFDQAEACRFERAVEEMWANLPDDYQWLKNWEYA